MRTLRQGGSLHQHFARGKTEPHDEFRRDRPLADFSAYAVRSEILPAHRFPPLPCPCVAASTARASRVAATSCTRTIVAPCSTASKAAAMLPARRSPTPRPVIAPRVDLRDHPAITGRPISASRWYLPMCPKVSATVVPY